MLYSLHLYLRNAIEYLNEYLPVKLSKVKNIVSIVYI